MGPSIPIAGMVLAWLGSASTPPWQLLWVEDTGVWAQLLGQPQGPSHPSHGEGETPTHCQSWWGAARCVVLCQPVNRSTAPLLQSMGRDSQCPGAEKGWPCPAETA